VNNRELKNKVTALLYDKAAENRLHGYAEEVSIEDVIQGANLALMEINRKGILKTSFDMDTCDPYTLLLGTAKYVLSGIIALKTRNYITVNDGGVSVNREGNLDLYYRVYEVIKQEFDQQLEADKSYMNLSGGWGN